jgi:hypothetical protein
MSTVSDRGTIGVVQKLVGKWIPSVPAVDNQCARTRAEIRNVLMQQIKLVHQALPCELQHPATEPVSRTAQPAGFTRLVVDGAVRQFIQIPRCRDGWISLE